MTSTPSKKAHPRRKLRRLLVAVVTLVIVCLVGDGILGAIFRSRIAGAVKSGMGADFTSRFAWYIPPRGVSLHHVRIASSQGDGKREELFTASRLTLKLAEFPKKGRPLVISLLRIDSPSITIMSATSPAPASEQKAVAAAASLTPSAPTAPAALPKPLADRFEIQNFKVTDGQITFESPGEDPLVLDHIDLALSPAGGSAGVYHFSGSTDENAAASLKGAGAINVEDMTLGLSEVSLQAKVGAILSQAHLSGSIRHRLEMARLDGTLNIRASASVPMKNWRQSTYSADIQLLSAGGALPDSSVVVNSAHGDFHVQYDGGRSPVTVKVAVLSADAGASHLQIDGGTFTTRDDRQAWEIAGLLGRLDLAGDIPALDRVHLKGRFVFTGGASGPTHLPRDPSLLEVVGHEFIVYPRDVSIQPPKYPIPLDHINGGPIAFRGSIIRFQNLNANYGGDQVLLDEGHITLDDPMHKIELADLRRQIKIDGISGTLICKQPGPEYPAALGKTIAQLRPTGSFAIGGGSWYAINRQQPDQLAKPKPDYFFRVSTAGGAFALTDHKVPLTDIHADASVSPMLVDIPELRGKMLNGTVIANTKITPVRPVLYKGTATFYNVNLQAASKDLGLTLKKPLIGTAYLKVNASGQGKGGDKPPLETFVADGEFQIIDGNFGDIQTVRAAASGVTKPDQVLDGEAAGLFSIRNKSVTLDNCAVGNPSFALEGSGTIGFDKTLNLHAVAAPLGDWREGLKRSNVPVLEDIGSDIAGAVQQLFAGAQRNLLWDIQITGTTTAPKIEQAVAPAITKPVATLFGQFLRGGKDEHLIDELRPGK